MADYIWARDGYILGILRVAGTDADEVETLPSRAVQRYLDEGYISLKPAAVDLSGKQDASTAATDAELASGLAGKQDAATAATDAELAAHEAAADPHPGYLTTAESNAAYVTSAAIQGQYVAASESTTSTAYTDLATAGPAATITVGSSGRVLVLIHAAGTSASTITYPCASFAVSGASTIAATDAYSVAVEVYRSGGAARVGGVFLMTGLTAGVTTFTCKYRTTANTSSFFDRHIVVFPL